MSFVRSIQTLFCALIVFCAGAFVAYGANIDPLNVGNDYAWVAQTGDRVNFDCAQCSVTVTDTAITGYAWGESLGWINFAPTNGGVVNNGSGVLSGSAWGQGAGWINFAPTNGGVSIVNGFFQGHAWSQNYGWVEFSCPSLTKCVQTAWGASSGSGSGGGSNPPADVYGCTVSFATNYNPLATSNDGSCVFTSVFGCTVVQATNYNPSATVDNGSCVFGDGTPTPVDPTPDPVPVDPVPDPDPIDPEIDVVVPTETVPDAGPDPVTVVDGVVDVAQTLGDAVTVVAETLGAILGTLGGLGTEQSMLPIIAIIASMLFGLKDAFNAPMRALQSLLSFFAPQKKQWGVVFDSHTKQPLDPVVVGLRDMTGTVVQTSITDMEGRFGFVAKAGQYTLTVNKDKYLFPSKDLAGKTNDNVYDELYFGDVFEIKQDGDMITKNIPMDALEFNWNEYEKARLGLGKRRRFVHLKAVLHTVSQILFYIGFAVSIYVVSVAPSTWNYIVVSLYVLNLTLRLLGYPRRAGAAVLQDGVPLSFAIMRVKSATIGREVKKVVLDSMGGYYCLIANGNYIVTFEARKPDGTYELIYTSEPFRVRTGIIQKQFKIKL